MTPTARQNLILEKARNGERIEVEALATDLAASRETIRRDLAQLDRAGVLRRVHGGAVIAAPHLLDASEDPFHRRMQQHVAAKRAMARHVAAGLSAGDSLFIDCGTTTLYLSEELSRLKGLIILTNSADVAYLAQRGDHHRVILIGGEFRGPGRETLGAAALAQIGSLRAAQAVLTVAALTEKGAFDIDPQEAEVARAMIRQADRVTILVDGSKMGRPGVFEVCPLSALHRIVTDHIPPAISAAAEQAGVQVDVTSPK